VGHAQRRLTTTLGCVSLPQQSISSPAARETSLLSLHFAVLLLGGIPLFSRLIPLPTTAITGYRGVIAVVCLLPIARMFRIPLAIRGRDLALVLLGGVLFALHWWTNFAAIRESSVAVAIAALYTSPIFTAWIEPLFERRLPSSRALAQAVAVAFGVWLTAGSAELAGRGVWLGLISAALLALRNVLQRRFLVAYSGLLIMLYQSAVTALVFAADAWPHLTALDTRSTVLLLVLGAGFTALPHALVTHALRTLPATRVSLILALQVLYVTLLGAWVLGETPSLSVCLGAAIIVATAIMAGRQQS